MSSEEKKRKQRQRSMAVFINAAIEIINEEGLSCLSIRKTADRAGYNSATLYHYFSDFDGLCTFAAIKFLDEYARDLQHYLQQTDRPLYKYVKVWECFCYHSFTHPDIFWLLFFKQMHTDYPLSHYFQTYYDIFPEDWNEELQGYKTMLTSDNLYEREYIALTKSLRKEGTLLPEETLHAINEMNILIYRGMLETLRTNPGFISAEEATARTVTYLQKTLTAYGIH